MTANDKAGMPDEIWVKEPTRADGGMYWLDKRGSNLIPYLRADLVEVNQELLEALRLCVQHSNMTPFTIKTANLAIAKATGVSNAQ